MNAIYHNNKSILNILSFVFLVQGLSCKKFVETKPPQTQVESSKIFGNDQAAISAVVGLYTQLNSVTLSLSSGGATVYLGLSSDEIYNTAQDINVDPFTKNSLVADNSYNYNRLWTPTYKYIYQANAILEGINNSSDLTDSLKRRLKGEMLVVRSFFYFYLANLYGDVPLVTTTDYRINSVILRNPKLEVLQQIVADLKEALIILDAPYPSVNRGRPNKWTAASLLARVYIYNKDWTNAEIQASAVINSGIYSLVTNLNQVFVPSSNETIWQVIRDNNNTPEGASFIPSSTSVKPTYVLTSFLLNAFQPGDQRKTAWTSKNTIASQDYFYPFKYKSRTSTQTTEYYIKFRLGEQYLIRAEARAQQNNISGARADLNIIRNRAGLAGTAANDQLSILLAIETERQIELFAEWGHRWLDLNRTGRANTVLGVEKNGDWHQTDALFPIPLSEIQLNPFLTQNPGY